MESNQPQTIPAKLAWTDLSGTILPGGYELKELLEADGETARFRVRVLGDRELDAVAQFLQVSEEETRRLSSAWDLIREGRHRNLTVPLGSGIWERDGSELVYVITRRAEESLDSVLRERALTPAEATDVLLSVAAALEALHVNGLVHGCLSPEQVLAVGDAIQLPVTCIRQAGLEPETPLVNPKYIAPEGLDFEGEDGENTTPESDIWCLGAILFEALTKKDWSEESREELAALPEPFATIALRCLEEDPASRARLAEIVALLRGEVKPVPRVRAATAASVSAPVATPVSLASAFPSGVPSVEEAPRIEGSPKSAPQAPGPDLPKQADMPAPSGSPEKPDRRPTPVTQPQSVRPPGNNGRVASPSPASNGTPSVVRAPSATNARTPPAKQSTVVASNRVWVWAGLALVFVLGLLWMLRPKPKVPSAAIQTGSTAQTAKAPAPVSKEPAAETKILQPDGTATPKPAAPAPREPSAAEAAPAPLPPAQTAAPASRTHKTINGDVWRVILYTYGRQEDAQRMSDSINRRHPDLHTEVFAPKEGGPYLVTMAAGNERQQADQARRRAVGQGMPRDSYVQNYSR